MFEDKSVLISELRRPMNLAAKALDELESRLGDGRVVADPNSPFCFLMEFSSSITAACIHAQDNKLPILYPRRARTMEDLYHHMSDFDYLRMYSAPAQTMLQVILPKAYLQQHALNFNDNYKLVTLPKDTVFMVGKYTFGLYYPINLLINNYTNSFTAVYDTSYTNPLMALTTNIVDKYDFTHQGVDFVGLRFPIYQFSKSIVETTLSAQTGFAEKFTYTNKFYAVRVFNYKDGEYTEMNQTQSHVVYDISHPTVLLRILSDENKLQITIPQIYFDEGVMGSKLYIEIYTTLGALDIDTSNAVDATIGVNFNLKSKDTTNFSAIFQNLPFDFILSLASNKISGGSNAIDVNTLRDRVVNDSLYEKAPISEEEIKVYLEDNNFYLKKYRDNVTERIYHAYRVIEDGNGGVVPSITLPMRVKKEYTQDHTASFKLQSDNSITVLPTAIFKYQNDTNDVEPLTDAELLNIKSMNKLQFANEFNNNQYFRTPYHVLLDLNESNPQSTSFDLMTPAIEGLVLEGENYNISSKMMAYGAQIHHLDSGSGGYEVLLSVFKSDDVKALAEENVMIYATVRTTDGYWIGGICEFQYEESDRYIYKFNIATNYHLTLNNTLGITNFQNPAVSINEHTIDLNADFHLIYLLNKTSVEGTYEDATAKILAGLPEIYLTTHVALVRQKLSLKLGSNLSNLISNDMEISSTPRTYVTWDHDVISTYEEDIYERDENGALKYTIDEDGVLQLNILHHAGDEKKDTEGNTIYLHKQGDIRYDNNGDPMIKLARSLIFYVDTILIDAKVFTSERTAEISFTTNMYEQLAGYLKIVANLQNQLLERTKLYFKCVRSTGSAKVNLGDGLILNQNVEMAFHLACYVPSYVKNSLELQDLITSKTCDAIEAAIKSKTISMFDLLSEVKDKLGDYIDHFTILGVDGDVANQTFVFIDEDAQPSVARKLELTDDNILSLNKQIKIEFIALEDNKSGTSSYEG